MNRGSEVQTTLVVLTVVINLLLILNQLNQASTTLVEDIKTPQPLSRKSVLFYPTLLRAKRSDVEEESDDEHGESRASLAQNETDDESSGSSSSSTSQKPKLIHKIEMPDAPETTARPGENMSQILNGNQSSKAPVTEPPGLLNSTEVHFDARDVTYFLESHPAHSINDPRAYFTEEKTTRSLSILLSELSVVPKRLKFAFVARIFNELGRKIASKLSHFTREVVAILRKTPDDLGNKPEVSMLVDAVHNAFESKLDMDPTDDESLDETPLTKLIGSDKEKAAVFNSSLAEMASRFSNLITYFIQEGNKTLEIPNHFIQPMSSYLCETLELGARTMILELKTTDKYRVTQETIDCALKIIKMTCDAFKSSVQGQYKPDPIVKKNFEQGAGLSFRDLNQLSDQTGLVGSWNSYLFANLGSAERVVKLLGSLLFRVPPTIKSRWINMYISQVNLELERALSGFVVMQGMPYNRGESHIYLLDPVRSVKIMPQKVPKPRDDYAADKNRIPARCYLAGRRWRLVLSRGLEGYNQKEEFLNKIADRIGRLKQGTVGQSGNEFYRLCMPRLEVGLRNWGINGEPQADQMNKFPLKNPIDNLNSMVDPFVAGARLGFNLGFKLAYNEERNATLELEAYGVGGGSDQKSREAAYKELVAETTYLARASFRRATTVAGQRAFPIAIREGYLSTLKLSVHAGMLIPAETGSRLAALKCKNYGGEAGLEAGRSIADNYISLRSFDDATRSQLIQLSNNYGLMAGQQIGEAIGAIVGKEAAEEAYKRGIIRGGKVARAKFHLDEYMAGAKLGFEHGLSEGKKTGSSSSLDPSAPRFFRFTQPVFNQNDKTDNEVDHWEKDLIPPLSPKIIESLHQSRKHTIVRGHLKGFYMAANEIKQGFQRKEYTNTTLNLDVFAEGFIKDNIAYLNLNGTVNKMGYIRGSMIARDIFNEDKV